jgi:4-amino-4-deoxy-L-arabinose transferase-like glycosyltransferase
LIFAWAAVLLIFIMPYPTTVWLLKHSPLPASKWLSLILAAGLGIGTLTWIMMLEGMLGIPFEVWSITLPYMLVNLIGAILWWRRHDRSSPSLLLRGGVRGGVESQSLKRLTRLVVIVISVAILFNAVYWPFYKDDAVGIYADQAHFMYATHGLIPLELTFYSYYQAYPMLVQLSYTYTYLVSGWEDPYLAKVIPTLLSLACLGAVFYLGKTLYDEKAGWLAVLLLALAPLFGRWASSGYADLPMAFYYTLAALFAWRAWQSNSPIDALISGITIGLGAWTKNAMLPAVAFWLAFMLFGFLRKRISFKALVVACLACAVVAAPWYLRNLIEAHLLMPATAWTDQAAPNLANLLVFITHPENFGITGWLILIGIVLALLKLVRHWRTADRDILLLTFTLPYFAFWWILASYDRRFLLYFLPILVVLAAGYAIKLWQRIPQSYQRSLGWLLTIITLGLTVYIATISIDYKAEIFRNPLMDDAAKHAVVSTKPAEP